MKLSLAWIFEHINADWKTISIDEFVSRFNQTTAEIEHVTRIMHNLGNVTGAQVTAVGDSTVTVRSDEWGQQFDLPARSGVAVGSWYLIKRTPVVMGLGSELAANEEIGWVASKDFNHSKEYLLPAVYGDEPLRTGSWKKLVDEQDYIIEVDNKSITNRPDLWGHRGIAREVAAIFNLQLKPLDPMLTDLASQDFDTQVSATATTPISVTIKEPAICKRFAYAYAKDVDNRPSLAAIALKLAKVDAKPINAIIDATNYVMFDLGQPMHAYDADAIPSKTLIPRFAKKGEKITLLDGQTLELSDQDLVIADAATPLALAGIMGGASVAIGESTRAIIIEAGCFDAATIRKSATRHKIRTESSARFEKSLDPYQDGVAIRRFVHLLTSAGLAMPIVGSLVGLGALSKPIEIEVTHEFLEKRLGVTLDPKFVRSTLEKLGFAVSQPTDFRYVVQVPSWRSTKDITLQEDIVEEIGRFFGYTNIPAVLPYKQVQLNDLTPTLNVRTIKQQLAYGLAMHELSTYALYDEQFLKELGWEPGPTLEIQNPISENWRRLLTSLIPNQLKAVVQNKNEHDSLRFFEWARVWNLEGIIKERKQLVGIMAEKKKAVDFYAAKEQLATFFKLLTLEVTWIKAETIPHWFMPHQTAQLMHGGRLIGYAGKINPVVFQKLCEGDAFLFELDADFLEQYKKPVVAYIPVSKYPEVVRDVSILIPMQFTVIDLSTRIAKCDPLITSVSLLDFFEKKEWKDQRSLTFRFVITPQEKTLTKQEVDQIYEKVIGSLQSIGAQIR